MELKLKDALAHVNTQIWPKHNLISIHLINFMNKSAPERAVQGTELSSYDFVKQTTVTIFYFSGIIPFLYLYEHRF